MTRVLVTGGRGVLSRGLVQRLQRAGHTVRVLSRAPRSNRAAGLDPPRPAIGLDRATSPPEWAQADLASGRGLLAAVKNVRVVIHTATSSFRRTRLVDVDGTQRLLEASRAAGVSHLIYVSIVGIERVPIPYYRHKRG